MRGSRCRLPLLVSLFLFGVPAVGVAAVSCPGQVGPRCAFTDAEVLVTSEPGVLRAPLDVAFGPGGRSYVADGEREGVLVYGADGRFERELRGPQSVRTRGVAVTPGGDVLSVAHWGNVLERWAANGSLVSHVELSGGFTYPATSITNYLSDVAVAPDGSVWVAYTRNRRVERIGADGTALEIIEQPDGGGFTGGFQTRLAIASDGSLWITTASGVQHVARNGTVLDTLTGPSWPAGVDVDPASGEVIIAWQSLELTRYAPDGAVLSTGSWYGADRPTQYSNAGSVTAGPDGALAVAETPAHRVAVLTPAFAISREIGRSLAGTPIQPEAIWPEGGDLLVSDLRSQRVVRISRAGAVLADWPTFWNSSLTDRSSVVAGIPDPDGSGSFVRADGLQRLAADGTREGAWDIPGGFNGNGMGLASDRSSGRIYATNSSSLAASSVLGFDRDGRQVIVIDGKTDGHPLKLPSRVAVLPGGEVVISHDGGIDLFTPDGHFQRQLSKAGAVAMTTDDQGLVWAVILGRLVAFDANGTLFAAFGDPFSQHGVFNLPHGLAWLDGSVYVADATSERVTRFRIDRSALQPLPTASPVPGLVPVPSLVPVAVAAPPKLSLAGVARRLRADRKGRIVLPLACLGAVGSTCSGRVTLRRTERRRTSTAASRKVTVKAGKVARTRVVLSTPVRRLLRRHRPVKLTARVAGASRAITVLPPAG